MYYVYFLIKRANKERHVRGEREREREKEKKKATESTLKQIAGIAAVHD